MVRKRLCIALTRGPAAFVCFVQQTYRRDSMYSGSGSRHYRPEAALHRPPS